MQDRTIVRYSEHMASTTAILIGRQVRLRREQRGLSAAELARRADLSKATLSALEGGSGNPTIDTLESLAVALALPLTDLLVATDDDARSVLVRATPTDGAEIQRELLTRVRGPHALEAWRLRMPSNTEFDGVPHAAGTIEHLYVATGQVSAGPTCAESSLRAGDLLYFPADVPHRYVTADSPADIHVILATPTR